MSNYPAGAENDPRAPWNEEEPEAVDVDVLVSISLSKQTTITTYDCIVSNTKETEHDGQDFNVIGITEYDYINCDLMSDYQHCEWTLPELLKDLKTYLENDLEHASNEAKKQFYESKLESLKGWTVDEHEVIKA